MTYKVLIVEDEQPAREVFRRMLESGVDRDEAAGEADKGDGAAAGARYEVVGEADNGKEGYALAVRERPDFVVLDITMPVVSGIEMLSEMKRTFGDAMPRTVILSCHQDFHYAQQAIQLGAAAYLLKDDCLADPGLLGRTLDGLIPGLVRTQDAARKQEELERKLRTNDLGISRQAFLETMRLGEAQWRDYLAAVGFPDAHPVHAVAIVEFDRRSLRVPAPDDAAEPELLLWQFAGVNVLQELLGRYGFAKPISLEGGRFAVLCAMQRLPDNAAGEVIAAFQTYLKINAFVRFWRLARPMAASLGDVKRLYKEKQLFFYETETEADAPGKIGDLNDPLFRPLPDDRAADWMQALKEAWIDYPLHGDRLDAFRREAVERRWHPDGVRNVYAGALLGVKLLDAGLPGEPGVPPSLIQEMNDCQTFRQLDQWMNERMAQHRQTGPSLSEPERFVYRVLETIHADLALPHSLSELAGAAGYSPAYFSQMFKRTVGQTFTRYLMNLRIQRAKQLLLTTDLKTFEIADRVGLDNYRHFNKIFKRIVGMSPSEFRARHANRRPPV